MEIHVLHSEVELPPGAALPGQDRHAQRAHQVAVGVHNHLAAQSLLKGRHNALVLADAALEHHRRDDFLPLAHVVEIVGHPRVAHAGDDVLPRMAHLDLVHQVRLGKHGTPGGDLGGVGGAQGVLADVLHLNAQPLGLAGEERPCPRRAEGVHGVVHRHAVFHQDDLGVLAANLQDGAHVGIKGGGAHGVGGDLVFHHSSPDDSAHQLPGAAGGAGGHDLIALLIKLLLQQAHQLLHRADGIALGPDILAGQQLIVLINNRALCGDGPHIYTEICVFQIKVPSFSFRSYRKTPPDGSSAPRRWSGSRRSGTAPESYNPRRWSAAPASRRSPACSRRT